MFLFDLGLTGPNLSSVHDGYVIALQLLIYLAVGLSVLVAADRIVHVFQYVYWQNCHKFRVKKPEDRYVFADLPDITESGSKYPNVAVQLPMFNERAVCQQIIDCVCEMTWPDSRVYVQILDDSTDEITRNLVDEKVLEWKERGRKIEAIRRTNRQGYKAGAMKEAMDAVEGYDYIAVFDADFQPSPDFLLQTIPYLEGNSDVGYVQTRWTFLNPNESYLTKAQEISLNFHVKCEQYVHFASGSFFNFNGTAGVWRRECIKSAGGWDARTTVEDMDLSLRAYLKGWKAVFLKDVTCKNELPSSFFAYRKQQHRWCCGPMQLWLKASKGIWRSKLPWYKKIYLNFCYFGVRKFGTHLVTLGFFCTLVPLSIFTPEVHVPFWALVWLPIAIAISTAAFTPRGWLHCVIYVLFENAMGIVRLWAVISGLLNLKRAKEWVVTTKMGSSDSRPATGQPPPGLRTCKLYTGEFIMSLFVLFAAVYGIFAVHRWDFSIFLSLQGLAFLAFGLNLVDMDALLGTFHKKQDNSSVAMTQLKRTKTSPF
ncbi:nucleotide-diphospho-sugar transferase [Chloropicon primus]|uniref:glucomannan 4-beta-mannosyltransferase n=1 Tax=Chloropicon primus TaxID=1764295 RepID=A0A5B8MNF1_9CHLO|nr:nucleotide-diphospho-sugar transferase [Chloropicon primus]UPR01147.1 nucleotide-diphospho-sugar transferase [Chloropicon primus]|eukprot:QDZ21927.1 nucleotide-diphospho-sugar transferase [Chloropicon primus]